MIRESIPLCRLVLEPLLPQAVVDRRRLAAVEPRSAEGVLEHQHSVGRVVQVALRSVDQVLADLRFKEARKGSKEGNR